MQPHEVKAEGLNEDEISPCCQRMIRTHDDNEPVVPVQQAAQTVRRNAAGTNADLGEPFRDAADDTGARPLLEVDLDGALRCQECPQILGQKLHDGREVREHSHDAPHALRVLCKLQRNSLGIPQHASGMVEEGFARRGRRHAARTAQEELHTEMLLQLDESLAHGRRGDRRMPRCLREAALLADGDKEAKRRQVEPPEQRWRQHSLLRVGTAVRAAIRRTTIAALRPRARDAWRDGGRAARASFGCLRQPAIRLS
jgi:hypothetical protein